MWIFVEKITQIQKAFKGELTDWFFSLKLLGIDTSDFENVKTAFENDYKVICVASRASLGSTCRLGGPT